MKKSVNTKRSRLKVKFKITLGDGCDSVYFDRACIKIYGVTKCRSELIDKFVVSKNYFELYLSNCHFSYFMITAKVRRCCHDHHHSTITLLSIFKNDALKVLINERTTVANIFCFSRFLDTSDCCSQVELSGEEECLDICHGMKDNFIRSDGKLSEVIQSNPNGLETNSYPMFNYLANIVFYCLIDKSINEEFLELTNSKNTVQGLHHIALHPFDNVEEIYNLIKDKVAIFKPALNTIILPDWKETPVPNQWTLTIKINDSGSKNFLIGGPGYLVFDENNRVWLNNNTRQGTPNSSTFCTILEPNGQPAAFSPLFGGGLLGAGFGIATTKDRDLVAIGNFGWGVTDYNPQDGSISLMKSNGTLLSPSNGFINGFKRAQGIFYDCQGNLWIAGWGSQAPLGGGGDSTFDFESANSSITVYIDGDPENYDTFEFDSEFHGTFDVVVDTKGNAYVSNSGNGSEGVPSSIYHFRLIDHKIIISNFWISDQSEAFRQVNISPNGFVYVGAVITQRILKFDKDLNLLDTFTNKIDGPWGIEFDSIGTMYVANFRADSIKVDIRTHDMAGIFAVTVIYDDDQSTAQIVTLPTGGDQIILKNGFPLYGSQGKPSFEPLMRMTGSRIDKVGNLWAVNNWKPAITVDFEGNPGGDGAVIFIGLAERPKQRHH